MSTVKWVISDVHHHHHRRHLVSPLHHHHLHHCEPRCLVGEADAHAHRRPELYIEEAAEVQ